MIVTIVVIVAKETKVAHKAKSRYMIVTKTMTMFMSKEDEIAR